MRLLKRPLLKLSAAFSRLIFGYVVVLSIGSLHAHGTPTSPDEWKQAAINDINEAYQIFVDNHPGTYDPNNPNFAEQLAAAKQRGLSYAVKVNDANSYSSAILGFTAALGDGHATLYPNVQSEKATPKWPSFFTVWRQQGLFVSKSNLSGIAVGAEVIACDGKPIKTLIEDNVFSFNGRKNELGQWWAYASHLFIDFHNPFITVPKHCVFRMENKKIEQNLVWQEIKENIIDVTTKDYIGDVNDVGVTEPRPKLLWVSMPSFQPDEPQRNSYRAIYAELQSNRQRYDNADALVIDLRKNQGGSSQWSTDFARELWGKEAVDQRREIKTLNEQTWWRASKGNIAYVQNDLVSWAKETKQLEYITYFEELGKNMNAALLKDLKFYIENNDDPKNKKQTQQNTNLAAAAFRKPVYVIVHGYCASACLDALDVFTLFDNTKIIGAPSSGDSTYMDVRYQKTTSGLGTVTIPNKVYVNRPRGNGEIYLPDIYVNDLEWSIANFLKHIEKDLAKRQLKTL